MNALTQANDCKNYRHTETPNIVTSYVLDCGYARIPLTPMAVMMALKYSYRPRRPSWSDLDITIVRETLRCAFSTWPANSGGERPAADELLREVEDFLSINSFDEAKAGGRLIFCKAAAREFLGGFQLDFRELSNKKMEACCAC